MKLTSKYIIVWFIFSLTACQSRKDVTENKSQSNVVKNYDDDGRLIATITIKDGKRNGITTTFYKDGTISTESNYINNVKTGVEKKYYENGAVYRTRQILNGKLNGEEKRFYRDGQLMTRLTYKDNLPANDLQEYYQSGNLIKNYPRLLVRIIRNRDYEKQKLIQFYFEDKSNPVQFYEGKLIEGKYFDNSASPLPVRNGYGELVVYNNFTGKITVSAKMITRNRAPYIVQKEYYVTADE